MLFVPHLYKRCCLSSRREDNASEHTVRACANGLTLSASTVDEVPGLTSTYWGQM